MDLPTFLSAVGFIVLFIAIGLAIRAFGGNRDGQNTRRYIDNGNPAIYWGKRGVGSTLNKHPRRR